LIVHSLGLHTVYAPSHGICRIAVQHRTVSDRVAAASATAGELVADTRHGWGEVRRWILRHEGGNGNQERGGKDKNQPAPVLWQCLRPPCAHTAGAPFRELSR